MDTTLLLYCLVAFIALVGVYKLGYYMGYRDGVEDGATLVTQVGLDIFERIVKAGFEDIEIER